jgi:CRP/FNR family nitrogen fixation transcriptional regulator
LNQGKGIAAVASVGVDEDTRALQQIGTKARIARNETIFSQGDEAAYGYKVVSGVVRLCKHMSDGRRHIAQFAFPGDFFSVMEFAHHGFTAEAVTDVVLMCYPQTRLSALRDERPGVGRRFVAMLSDSLGEMQNHLTVLGRQSAKERVASFLLYLTEHVGCEEDDLIDTPMSRHDIADYLGLTNETVCRVISELRRERVIETPSVRQFILLDADALHALADGEPQLAAA